MFPHNENITKFYHGGETVVSPLVLVGVLLAAVLLLALPRKYAIWAYLIPAVFIPMGQVVMVAGLHLRMTRLLAIVGLARVLMARGSEKVKTNVLDRYFLYWALAFCTIFILRWRTSGALINQLGDLYDTLAIYWVLRFLIRDEQDVLRTIRVFAVICCLVACFMVVESRTGINPLSVLGGVRLLSEVRNGKVRAQGPFGHSILAGSFGAVLIALFIGLWVRDKKGRLYSLAGIAAALTMTWACASSTPAMAIAGGIGAISLWKLREKMSLIRRGIVATLIGLELVMKAHVWWLISHVDITGGSTGWDRSALIDNAIWHFREWWLLGTNNNPNWGYNMFDLCVQYVAQGVQGGLLTLVLFITIIVICFKRIGNARRALKGDFRREFFVWSVGGCLFSHVCSFFGSSYWDQTIVGWFALLAIVSAVTTLPTITEPAEKIAEPGWAWAPEANSPKQDMPVEVFSRI